MNRAILTTLGLLTTFSVNAQDTIGSDAGYLRNPLFILLLILILLLAVVILTLAGAMKTVISSEMFVNRLKHMQDNTLSRKGWLLMSAPAAGIGGIDYTTFYIMLVIIGIEFLVLTMLYFTFRSILEIGYEKKSKPVVATKKTKNILDKINDTVTIEEEDKITLEHEYDGIRELDNVLPPWWKYGFYLTIVVSVIYMFIYHVTGTFPLQKEEYEISMKRAEAEVAAYMKNSALNVDETTVKLLTDPADIEAGKEMYFSSCVACHGRSGEGGVGPNLTDDYWLHSGGVADIFKSIKYGWPDKGMKSWKEDFSPMQIAQITSYIKSLRGTNPPNAKEKQGEFYREPASDSLTTDAPNPDRQIVSQVSEQQ